MLTLEEKKQRKRESDHRSYLRHREKRIAYIKAWTEANKDHVRDKRRISNKRWRDRPEVKERHSLLIKARRERDPEKHKQWAKTSRQRADSHLRAKRKADYWADPERHRKRVSEWNKAHPEVLRQRNRERRARRRNASGRHSHEAWLLKVSYYGWRCFYCRCELIESTLTQDHAIPLVRGGTDWLSNLLPACRGCNSKKRTRTVFEYLSIREAR